MRYWDGLGWTEHTAPLPSTNYATARTYATSEKSSGLAVLFTVLWPGAGHLYLGLTSKGTPHVVANAIGLVLALALLPITFLIWLVTLLMLIGSVNSDTERVNEGIRRGERIQG